MKRIVLTIVALVVVLTSLIIIPPTAMNVQQQGNNVKEVSQSLPSEQSTTQSNGKVASEGNSNNKATAQDNSNSKVAIQDDNTSNKGTMNQNSNGKAPAMGNKDNSDTNFVQLKSTTNKSALKMTVGTTTGKKGSTVTVPITFSNVNKVGNVGTCNFYLKYNKNALKVVSVKAGNIVASPAANFSSAIDSKNGKISLLFLDNTIGKQIIKKDGTFATVTFKIIGSKQNSPITFTNGGAVGNSKMLKISNVNHVNGSVKIK